MRRPWAGGESASRTLRTTVHSYISEHGYGINPSHFPRPRAVYSANHCTLVRSLSTHCFPAYGGSEADASVCRRCSAELPPSTCPSEAHTSSCRQPNALSASPCLMAGAKQMPACPVCPHSAERFPAHRGAGEADACVHIARTAWRTSLRLKIGSVERLTHVCAAAPQTQPYPHPQPFPADDGGGEAGRCVYRLPSAKRFSRTWLQQGEGWSVRVRPRSEARPSR